MDICITCTSSKSPVLTDDLDLRGCFVAAMGADNPEKQEIAPALMRRARILVDDIEACASCGDLNHALRAGAISKDGVHSDLAELASGRKQGRMTQDELVIFDSSGSGVQDVAAAWIAYRDASRADIGLRFDLVGPNKQSQHCLRALSRRMVKWWTQRRGRRDDDLDSLPNHLLADIGVRPDELRGAAPVGRKWLL